MIAPKLLSYTSVDFPTKAKMNLYIKLLEQRDNDKKNNEKLKEAGLLRRSLSQIWNTQNVLRIGISSKNKDENSFKNYCVNL